MELFQNSCIPWKYKPVFILMYFTVYIQKLMALYQICTSKRRTNPSLEGQHLFTGFKPFSMWTDTNKTNHALREIFGHWRSSSQVVGHGFLFFVFCFVLVFLVEKNLNTITNNSVATPKLKRKSHIINVHSFPWQDYDIISTLSFVF